MLSCWEYFLPIFWKDRDVSELRLNPSIVSGTSLIQFRYTRYPVPLICQAPLRHPCTGARPGNWPGPAHHRLQQLRQPRHLRSVPARGTAATHPAHPPAHPCHPSQQWRGNYFFNVLHFIPHTYFYWLIITIIIKFILHTGNYYLQLGKGMFWWPQLPVYAGLATIIIYIAIIHIYIVPGVPGKFPKT